MKGFITTKEAAERWGITIRQVQNLCKKGHIAGVERAGTVWLIPEGAQRPKYVFVSEPTANENSQANLDKS